MASSSAPDSLREKVEELMKKLAMTYPGSWSTPGDGGIQVYNREGHKVASAYPVGLDKWTISVYAEPEL